LIHSPDDHYIAIHDLQKLFEFDNLLEVYSLVINNKQFIVLSLESSTRVLEYSDRLTEVEYDEQGFILNGTTTSLKHNDTFVAQTVGH
jgi:hypothetical protein